MVVKFWRLAKTKDELVTHLLHVLENLRIRIPGNVNDADVGRDASDPAFAAIPGVFQDPGTPFHEARLIIQ